MTVLSPGFANSAADAAAAALPLAKSANGSIRSLPLGKVAELAQSSAQSSLVSAINHILNQSAWASLTLRPYADQCVKVALPPFSFLIQITPAGLIKIPVTDALSNLPVPDVVIDLPATTPLLALQGQAAVMHHAKIQGSANLAQALAKLIEHLRWDAEADLSRLVGDMAAHRMVAGAHTLLSSSKDKAHMLTENLLEYVTEERPVFIRRIAIADFSDLVAQLQHDLNHLEQRLQRLPKT